MQMSDVTGSDRPDGRGKRRYDNSRRARKAEQTRNQILRALAGQLTAGNSAGFSVDAAAREAGVTARTVFRHFPTKDDMLAALSQWVLSITGNVPLPDGAEQLADTVIDSYTLFEDNAELMQALLLSEAGRGVRSRLTSRRRQGLAAALAGPVDHLPARQRRAVQALLTHLMTAETWWQLRKEYGVNGEDSARAVAWVVGLALEALERGEAPA
jgi:AcrR family transcriptional regulator